MDSSNRISLRVAEPVTIGNSYKFTWPMLPDDFTFAAGHRVGIVIGGNFSGYGSTNGMTQTDITIDTMLSKIKLPIMGGYSAAVAAGLFGEAVEAPVGGTVPATLALSLGAPASFGAFTPGTTKEYTAAHDRERHLLRGRRGPHGLRARPPDQRRVQPRRAAAGGVQPGGLDGPVSNDTVEIAFKQLVKAPIRSGPAATARR